MVGSYTVRERQKKLELWGNPNLNARDQELTEIGSRSISQVKFLFCGKTINIGIC